MIQPRRRSTAEAKPERARRVDQILDQPATSLDVAAFRAGLGPVAARAVETPFEPQWQLSVTLEDQVQAIEGGSTPAAARFEPATRPGATPQLLEALAAAAVAPVRLIDLAAEVRLPPEEVLRAVRAQLGTRFVLPAVAELRAQVDEFEVSRWPGSPYQVSRTYWRNNVAVRAELDRFGAALGDASAFARHLRELHVTYLMGEDLETFYYPSSETRAQFASGAAGPGQFRTHGVVCPLDHDFEIRYFRLLAATVGDGFCDNENRPIRDDDGVLLGETRWTWMGCRRPEAGAHLFASVDKLLPDHLRRLWRAAAEAHDALGSGDTEALLGALARFFRRFVCLHPFVCGNMGLVMNVVNWFLRHGCGGYVCHLHLDWCAQRFEPAKFEVVFRRAVERYLVKVDNPASRTEILDRFAAARAAIEVLARTGGSEAREWLAQHGDARSAVLL